MGAPFGNCNACKSGSYGRKKSYLSKSDINNLAIGYEKGWRNKKFIAASKKVSARFRNTNKSTKFIKNIQKSVNKQRLMSGL